MAERTVLLDATRAVVMVGVPGLSQAGATGRRSDATARERNPDASLHPWLTAASIVALGYPPEQGLSASGVRSRKARVLEDLAAFEAEGLIVFEAHPDGRRWRVLPPDTDPA